MSYVDRLGDKCLSRNWLANGNFSGNPRGFRAKTVLSLTGSNCTCIRQGVHYGYIRPDAKIFGVERDDQVASHAIQTAETHDLDLSVFHGELYDFTPPKKIDMAIIDLMGVTSHALGRYLRDSLVPNMSSRRAGIGINLNIQRTSSSRDMKDFSQIYQDAGPVWDAVWKQNYQCGTTADMANDKLKPFTGVAGGGVPLTTFVGVHQYMKDTNFVYRGCFRYFERSSSTAGVHYMLSLRYERA
jgi:hypothetical protein